MGFMGGSDHDRLCGEAKRGWAVREDSNLSPISVVKFSTD